MINATWDIFALLFIVFYWVETKSKTLEEIDELLDGVKHSDVPNIHSVMSGKEEIGDIMRGYNFGQGATSTAGPSEPAGTETVK